MAFPRSLDTKAKGEFVTRHFSWDRRFELAVAEQAAEYYKFPELPRNRRFGRWSRPLLSSVGVPSSRESARFRPKGIWGRIREPVDRKRAWAGERQMRTRPLRKRPPLRMTSPNSSSINTTSFSHIGYSSIHLSRGVVQNAVRSVSLFFGKHGVPSYFNTREMANYVRETFIWHSRSASRPPRPFPEDFHVLCLRFSLAEAEGATVEFELPEIATFQAMLLNETVELGVAHEYKAKSMKSSLLYWPADEVEVRGSQDGQEEGSGSAGPPAPSSDEE
ncbi:LOW QUALITY PROTEIN: hypothetical protein Cgig2_032059 [Carnegiea gigantea]|uniref:Uncharacterized protein n=1 Tax=Carnegiea gigantea TaxID=171969 RepID=A0A9Q1JZR7_9CARY|nr:LOW QUALITY PROTEIN: hypothetical protein Cgig2_032059 [Carnegiea gigantea]